MEKGYIVNEDDVLKGTYKEINKYEYLISISTGHYRIQKSKTNEWLKERNLYKYQEED